MELKIEHVVDDNFTVQDQDGCYLDANGDRHGLAYLKGFEVVAVVQMFVDAQS